MISFDFDAKSFQKKLAAYQKKTKKTVEQVIEETANTVLAEAIENTPVDTGNAKGNWRLKKLTEKLYSIYNNTAYIRVLEYGGYKGRAGKTQSGVSGWTNDYVSKQAPIGMLRRAIRDTKKQISKAIK